ncbi:MAG: serine/threonine-protein phosphatase [Gemmatimonadota bacterium]|nr:MAG: serine/threonine-protein phosphatase [Gemmatimonadota bacterium]
MHSSERKPLDHEFDVFGVSDVGKVRKRNEDQFLICSLHKRMNVHSTSLPSMDLLPLSGERMAFLILVADGVGGHAGGDKASRMATETIARYITHSMQCYYTRDPNENEFLDQLHKTVMQCHEDLVTESKKQPDTGGMATTLTLLLGMWPRGYIVQVGDSRCYRLRGEELIQITRDQTLAQDLVDKGVLTPSKAGAWSHVLSSAMGGAEARPVIYKIELNWDDVILLCSDGLTAHVTDDEIHEELSNMESAEQVGRKLLATALERGGRDNITLVIGTTKPA